jgi:hypothetical protein
MFAPRYFSETFFTPRYWPPGAGIVSGGLLGDVDAVPFTWGRILVYAALRGRIVCNDGAFIYGS